MASDPSWTRELGDAFLSQQPQVMDAVQRERQKAYNYGYLRSNPQIVVTNGPYIAIAPVNPGFIVVPYYNPAVVFFPPRPGFFVGGAGSDLISASHSGSRSGRGAGAAITGSIGAAMQSSSTTRDGDGPGSTALSMCIPHTLGFACMRVRAV